MSGHVWPELLHRTVGSLVGVLRSAWGCNSETRKYIVMAWPPNGCGLFCLWPLDTFLLFHDTDHVKLNSAWTFTNKKWGVWLLLMTYTRGFTVTTVVMSYHIIEFGEYWFRLWLVAWRHQAITWPNVDFYVKWTLTNIHVFDISVKY